MQTVSTQQRPGKETEVIVIGGGAAGTATAIHLARQGRRVVVLEGRAPHPPRLSDLHSGEVLSPGSQRELARLGLVAPTRWAETDYLNTWRLHDWDTIAQQWPDGHRSVDRLPGGLAYWQINRGRFYQALQELACAEGVEVRQGWRVINLLREAGGSIRGVVARPHFARPASAPLELRAPVVVDASGRNSVVLARLGLRQAEPEFRRAAYIFFFSELAGENPPPGVWEQYWLAAGSTLRGSRLAAGLYRYSFELSLRERDRWLGRFGRLDPFELLVRILADQNPALARRFAQARRLPHLVAFVPIGYRVNQLAQDGLLMIGDAAGYLDPATGQGIEFALHTGRLAAQSIADAFRVNRFDRAAFDRYLRDYKREVQPVVRDLRLYLRLSRSPLLLKAIGRVAPARRGLLRYLITPRP